ncbi:MAG: SMC-Scp complex subunit ScpB [Spirochaetales bacterium]
MDLYKETSIVEAIFFLEGEPLSIDALVRISNLSKDVIIACIEKLKERYEHEDCAFELSQISGGWVLGTKRDLWNSLKERYGKKNEGKLSRAAVETLSIIAYSQPITRGEIEAIRGVSADNMIRLLFDRKLIKEVGKKDVPGKPVQYGTTKEFLKLFRMNSIADLPKLDEAESERFELAR